MFWWSQGWIVIGVKRPVNQYASRHRYLKDLKDFHKYAGEWAREAVERQIRASQTEVFQAQSTVSYLKEKNSKRKTEQKRPSKGTNKGSSKSKKLLWIYQQEGSLISQAAVSHCSLITQRHGQIRSLKSLNKATLISRQISAKIVHVFPWCPVFQRQQAAVWPYDFPLPTWRTSNNCVVHLDG